jgi:SAM-dependent methyltransferase
MNDSATDYEGDQGETYLQHRKSSLSDHVQGLRASVFKDLGAPDRTILDFGCGSGGILSRLEARERIGIEIGSAAAQLARQAGIRVFTSLEEGLDDTADVVISFHAIEHVDRPIDILRELVRVAKPGALIRLVVPGEMPTLSGHKVWRPNPDRHLYTWTPLLFGNLAERSGFSNFSTRLEPMPTGSRLLKYLSILPPLARARHWYWARKTNALNVILEATAARA